MAAAAKRGRAARPKGAPSASRRPGRDASFVTFVLEQLEEPRGVRARAMFGGHGLYRGERFFGIVFGGRLYFRVDDASRPEYEARGMEAFTPGPGTAMRSYFEVPVDVLEDRSALSRWAERALEAAPPGRSRGRTSPGKPRRS